MAAWTQTESTSGERVFCRPLGVTETGFYYDSLFNSTADSVMHIHLRATQNDDAEIYSPSNVMRAWLSVKQRFPLLAAEVREADAQSHPEHQIPTSTSNTNPCITTESNSDSRPTIQFVLREQCLTTLHTHPADITFKPVSSFDVAHQSVLAIMAGPRPLSSSLLARLYILPRTDDPAHFHVIIIIAHCITDGASTSTVLRTFFDTLASRVEHPVIPLTERLPMFCSLESRIPYGNLSTARRRWRRALGFAIYTVWKTRFQGGHTLPSRFTPDTPYTPARSGVLVSTFTPATSTLILANCRRYDITLTTAYYALSQVALARVLCRRRLRGEIGDAEWAYRARQPMHFHGPLNLRPYLHSEWFAQGGSGDVGLGISFFQYTLPFMPLGKMHGLSKEKRGLELVSEAPRFEDLMSFERFLFRCTAAKEQAERIFNHPRFLDISVAAHVDRIPPSKEAALHWVANGESVGKRTSADVIPVEELGPVLSQGGSSLGNMDSLVPVNYPLPPTHPLSPLSPKHHPHRAGYLPVAPSSATNSSEQTTTPAPPRLHVEYWRTHLHARFGELYLGASTSRKELQYFVFYDGNVFEQEVVKEWLDEVRDATMWYLGRPANLNGAGGVDSGADSEGDNRGIAGLGGRARSKL
ncbi:hypothetical protein BJ138DRAFT_187093 [Hygrophoropsis aurantiaca]|uniref:Uncharacterized protein n=1 Tax=Hygrophoropsis aurantiaca TaxID=72124 RepID=A0ACB8AAU0_9AGAM|nr:hypothetical protein BJ138DRAFT_187093 [Hygrophoropsis aurantiaca]